MSISKRLEGATLALLLAGAFGLGGCETQGSFEEAGEEIDEAVDEVDDARDNR